MYIRYLFVLPAIILFGFTQCGKPDASKNAEIQELKKEISALKEMVIEQRVNQPDTVILQSANINQETREEPFVPKGANEMGNERSARPGKTIPEKARNVKTESQNVATTLKISDTLFYYYHSGQVSVKVLPFAEGSRAVILYDLNGEETIRFEDVRLNASVLHYLRFGAKGNVVGVNVLEIPELVNFWFECNVSFTHPNQPSWMVCEKKPQPFNFANERRKYFWNKKEKTWS
ncbi:MAG: hypothetical protein ACXITV_06195 [Luteibaculaceae bacterium]